MFNWILGLFKKPDMATAIILLCGIIFALIRFLWWVVKEVKTSQKEYRELVANHIPHNTAILNECSKTMEKLSGEHDRMIGELIKLNERTKK